MKIVTIPGMQFVFVIIMLSGCMSTDDIKTPDNPFTPTIPVSFSYPYPGSVTIQLPDLYPLSSNTQQAQSIKVTPKPSETPYPSPMPVSDIALTTAMKNIDDFLNELPFASEAVYDYREYYGCQDSQNVGITIYYDVLRHTSDNIKSQYVEFFDYINMEYEPWTKLSMPGFSGFAWKTSAVYDQNTGGKSQAAMYITFIEYASHAASEQSNIGTTQEMNKTKAEIHLWFSYWEKNEKIIIPSMRKEILNTCENGWWLALNP